MTLSSLFVSPLLMVVGAALLAGLFLVSVVLIMAILVLMSPIFAVVASLLMASLFAEVVGMLAALVVAILLLSALFVTGLLVEVALASIKAVDSREKEILSLMQLKSRQLSSSPFIAVFVKELLLLLEFVQLMNLVLSFRGMSLFEGSVFLPFVALLSLFALLLFVMITA